MAILDMGTSSDVILVLVERMLAAKTTIVATFVESVEHARAGIRLVRLVRAGAALVVLVRVNACKVGLDSFSSTEQTIVGRCCLLGDRDHCQMDVFILPIPTCSVLSEPDGNT